MKIYLVGGAVRDQLLQRPITERDWVIVGGSTEELIKQGYRPVGKDFPVFLHPQTHEEYALARTERKIGKGYKQFTVYASPEVTLEEDLLRRDITINAMAQTLDGKLIDPYGGQKDLENKLLRHVSPAFSEDPVRILRIGRFAARYGFSIAEETMQLMLTMVRMGEVDALVPERVWQETQKALTESMPWRFFEVLRQCGALAILFPEIDRLFGVPSSKKWHPEIDTGLHTVMVLKQSTKLSTAPEVRFAALVHDLGKGITPIDKWPKHHGHEITSLPLITQLCKRYKIPFNYQSIALLVAKFHTHCHQALNLNANTLLKTLEQLDAFRRPTRFCDFLLACEADNKGRKGAENGNYPQSTFFKRVHEIASSVSIKPFLEKGLQDKALGEALHQERVRLIRKQLPILHLEAQNAG
ncbi:MAG: Multifunctional CCA protein [Legionellaceae bacterium]